GYNIIAYLRQDASPVVSELAGIVSNVSLFKDEDGLVYWPYFNIDLIGDLKPGKGYKIKVDVPVSLTYSANGPGNTTKTAINRMMPQNYADIAKTNNNMTLGIPMYAWNEIPTVGDEIGVFTAEGQLIGSTVFEGNNIAIALFGDDDLTEQKEGLQVDEVFTIKVWNQLNNTENVCKVVSWETGSDNYSVDGISVIKNIIVTNGNIDGQTALYQNIPNPFSTSTKIGFYIPEESNVNITIYNVLGESVMEVVSGSLQAGYHNYEISANELASGSYFYKFVTKDYTETKHMNIEK
ncbi:MAG: T9SS type A sorting domain-containing protein, partial [Bacteroidota bacterium]|nr:T9SS type A sorting domain-containing protein [Bacteroidota bacterium]